MAPRPKQATKKPAAASAPAPVKKAAKTSTVSKVGRPKAPAAGKTEKLKAVPNSASKDKLVAVVAHNKKQRAKKDADAAKSKVAAKPKKDADAPKKPPVKDLLTTGRVHVTTDNDGSVADKLKTKSHYFKQVFVDEHNSNQWKEVVLKGQKTGAEVKARAEELFRLRLEHKKAKKLAKEQSMSKPDPPAGLAHQRYDPETLAVSKKSLVPLCHFMDEVTLRMLDQTAILLQTSETLNDSILSGAFRRIAPRTAETDRIVRAGHKAVEVYMQTTQKED